MPMNNAQIAEHWKKTLEAIKSDPALLRNKLWRVENLYMVVNEKGRRTIFKMNRAQRHYVSNRKHRNIILKSRQLGFTTLITIWNLDNVLFTLNTEALSIAHTKDGMSQIFDKKVRYALANMHQEIQDIWQFNKNSTTKIQVQTHDGSVSSFAVSMSGRSGTYQFVHISEFAPLCVMFPQRAEEVITGTFPAVPIDGEIDIESTGEGAYGRYYDMFIEAQASMQYFNKSLSQVQFYPHFYNWTWDDKELSEITENIPIEEMEKGDIDWLSVQIEHGFTDKEMTYYYRKWVSLNKNTEKLQQQYPCTWQEAFIASGRPYFNARKVTELMLKVMPGKRMDVIAGSVVESYNGPLTVYRKPDKRCQYVIGGDTAEGLSTGDSSTMVVINVQTRDIDAIYEGKIEPFEFSDHLYRVGAYYNNALLAVESNKDGRWVNDNLSRAGYPNLYFREVMDDITKETGKLFGWLTNTVTRDPMLTELKMQFTKRDMPYMPLLTEMMTFIRNKRNRPEASSGKHDDVIIAAAIGYEVLKQKYRDVIEMTGPDQSYMEQIFGK